MLGLSVIILFNLIFNVNSNLQESSANCSGKNYCHSDQNLIWHQMLMKVEHPRGRRSLGIPEGIQRLRQLRSAKYTHAWQIRRWQLPKYTQSQRPGGRRS